jgi:hypothetical protein
MAFSNITVNTLNRTYVSPSLRSIPTLEGGDIRIASNKQIRTNPNQDTIMLLGHADTADGIYEPFEVYNLVEAINYMGADETSPLVRALLELTDSGCQNIVIYPVASMDEYVSEIDLNARFNVHAEWDADTDTESDSAFPSLSSVTLNWTGNNFYERYYNRLHVAYSRLESSGGLEGIGILVPVEAPFYYTGDVDFLGQLVDFCHTYFTEKGSVSLGVLGTRIELYNQGAIDAMVADDRLSPTLSVYPQYGKYVMVVAGEGIISHRDTSLTHNAALATQAAANLAIYPLNRSICGQKLTGCLNLSRISLTQEQAQSLALARINPVVRTSKGKRGFAFEVKLLTDNTVSAIEEERFGLGRSTDTNYWAMSQMHIVAAVINQVKQYGEVLIGERMTQTQDFQDSVRDLLVNMRENDYIKDFSLNIEPVENEYKLLVSIGLSLIYGVRNIYFQVEAGPGA